MDLIPKTIKISEFLSILYSKPLREYRKSMFKIGDRVRISKFDIPFRKGYKPQFTQELFEIVAISPRKPPTYTIKDEQVEINRGKLYQKELIKVFQQWNFLNRIGFKCIYALIFRQLTELFYKLFFQSN